MLHRERRRVIQQSYRKRLDKRAKTAEEGVKRLQREVRLLELQRERLRASIPTRSTPWNVIVEYFSLFRHGLESDSLEADSRSTNVGRLSPSDKQLQFVRSTMASDVVVKTGIGEEALLGIWKHANLRHQNFTTHLVRLELGEGDVGMIATVKCTFTITTATLVHEFPHLLNEEDEPSPLARQLLGQQVGVVTTVHFMWDASLNRMTKVTGVRYRNEMVTPLLKLLGNMQNVACVLRSTGITSSMG
ncbi:unnamed protein product [Phytophthora lilii]|uniref:Unnamed protein product n=1 Tax=Phytophthora lilii TaxID=2077276 RepID=A0A9W6X168_9STRA|nr:unnamed protein product [Phytophthora lilii]